MIWSELLVVVVNFGEAGDVVETATAFPAGLETVAVLGELEAGTIVSFWSVFAEKVIDLGERRTGSPSGAVGLLLEVLLASGLGGVGAAVTGFFARKSASAMMAVSEDCTSFSRGSSVS